MLPRLGDLTLDASALAGLGLLLAAGAVLYVIALVVLTAWRLMTPPRRTYAWAVARGLPGDPYESCGADFTDAEDALGLARTTRVWDIPGATPTGPAVIITHGWGSGRVEMLTRLPTLREPASRVLMWDMPGHGDTPGLSLLGARAVPILTTLIDRCDTDVVLYGWSLGAEVSLLAAAQRDRLAGLILEAPYRRGLTPAVNVLRAARAPIGVNLAPALTLIGLAAGDPARRFRDLTITAAAVRAPSLILSGERDTISPPADAEAFAQAMRATLERVPGAGHADLWTDNDARRLAASAVTRFVHEIGESPGATS